MRRAFFFFFFSSKQRCTLAMLSGARQCSVPVCYMAGEFKPSAVVHFSRRPRPFGPMLDLFRLDRTFYIPESAPEHGGGTSGGPALCDLRCTSTTTFPWQPSWRFVASRCRAYIRPGGQVRLALCRLRLDDDELCASQLAAGEQLLCFLAQVVLAFRCSKKSCSKKSCSKKSSPETTPELGGVAKVRLTLRGLCLDGDTFHFLLEPRHRGDRLPLRLPLTTQLLSKCK